MDLQNPVNFIADNPNNPIEQAKNAIGDAVNSALSTTLGQKALGALKYPLEELSLAAVPFRDYVAPPLSAALLTANSNYRAQNKNLSLSEQFDHAKTLAVAEVDPSNPWRRSVSPGRALVGLIGDYTPGKQGTDKLDWENSAQVQSYFTSGSAQFFSGISDVGFNMLDPVAMLGGKGLKVAKKSLITRPAGTRYGTAETLSAEMQHAVANPGSGTPADIFLNFVEKDTTNVTKLMNHPQVAASANPRRYATALAAANEQGGRELVSKYFLASIGNKAAYDDIVANHATLAEHLYANNQTTASIQKQIADMSEARWNIDKNDLQQIAAHEEAQKQLFVDLKKSEADNATLIKQMSPSKYMSESAEVLPVTLSKFPMIEKLRATTASALTDGTFVETDGVNKFNLTRAVAGELNIPAPVVRTLLWVAPATPLREVPAGVAFIGGTAGDRSYLEFDARVSNYAKLAGVSKAEQVALKEEYRLINSASERFTALDNLGMKTIRGITAKHYGRDIQKMNPKQTEAFDVFVSEIHSRTRRAQIRETKNIMEKHYTMVDQLSGNTIAVNYLKDIVEKSAQEIAYSAGRGEVKESDRNLAMQMMTNETLTSTQVPNIHFSPDYHQFDDIMAEHPALIKSVIHLIMEKDATPNDVRNFMQKAEESHLAQGDGFAKTYNGLIRPMSRSAYDVATDKMDAFFTYAWKPFTLMSLKYTSRNLAEGWLRMVFCMSEYSSTMGYGWTDMFKSTSDSGSLKRYVNNRGYRRSSKQSNKDFNNKNIELLQTQGILDKQIAPPSTSAQDLIKFSRKNLVDSVKLKEYEHADGITMSMEMLKKQLIASKKYKSSGVPEADAAMKFLNEDIRNTFGTFQVSPGNSQAFADALLKSDYKIAHSLASGSKSAPIVGSLQDISNAVKPLYAKLQTIKETGVPSVDTAVINARNAFDRMQVHIDTTKDLVVTRGSLRDELTAINQKMTLGKESRKSFTNKDHVVIWRNPETGQEIKIDQSLAGVADEMLRNATSSRSSSTGVLANDVRLTAKGLMASGVRRDAVVPSDGLWVRAHSDYVNNVLMRDSVGRHIVEQLAAGDTLPDAITATKEWIKTGSSEVLDWKAQVKQNTIARGKASSNGRYSYNNIIDETAFQIAQYLPERSTETGAAYNLYEKALNGLHVDDSSKLHYLDREQVMYNKEQEEITFTNLYKNAVSNIFEAVGTLPEDHLMRHPFFNMVHDNEAMRVASVLDKEVRKANPNITDAEVAKYIAARAGGIKKTAVDRAYKELMTKLYSIERYTTPGRFFRFLTPFYMAQQNSTRFWLGMSLRNPETAYILAKIYNAPYRSGKVQDENGNLVSAGNPYTSSPREKIILGAPELIRRYTGRDTVSYSPTSFDVISSGQYPIPTAGGPISGVITAEVLKKVAQDGRTDAFLQKHFNTTFDDFAAKAILPFYQRQSGRGVVSNAVQSTIPLNSAVKAAIASVTHGHSPFTASNDRWTTALSSARQEVFAERQLKGLPVDDRSVNAEATRIAQNSLVVEAISAGVGPVGAFQTESSTTRGLNNQIKQLQLPTTKPDGTVVPGMNYSDALAAVTNQLMQGNIELGAGVVSSVTSSSANNRFGFLSNSKTISAIGENSNSISVLDSNFPSNPFIAQLFNQTDSKGNYSAIADDAMYSIKINDKPLKDRNLTAEESARQIQFKAAWATYFSYMDYVNADATAKGYVVGSPKYNTAYKPVKTALADAIGKKYPQWGVKSETITLHQSDSYLSIADYLVNDKKFMSTVGGKSDAVKGLQLYLQTRNEISKAFLANAQATGTSTLTARANQKYADLNSQVAIEIYKLHPDFKQMYERYLSGDELQPITSIRNGK